MLSRKISTVSNEERFILELKLFKKNIMEYFYLLSILRVFGYSMLIFPPVLLLSENEDIDEYIDSLENLQRNILEVEEQLVDIETYLRDLEESENRGRKKEVEEARSLFEEISDLIRDLKRLVEKTRFLISDIEAGEPTQESLEDKILSLAETLEEAYNVLDDVEEKKRELDELIGSLE